MAAKTCPAEALCKGGFYDRIIRNKDELNKTRQYIIDNPMNWKNDMHYSDK